VTVELFLQICGVLGLLVSIASIVVAMRANKEARTANRISAMSNQIAEESNKISAESNEVAHRVERLQVDEAAVRLVVKPRMRIVVGLDRDHRPRPVVQVINLSSFPVTLGAIGWRSSTPAYPHVLWVRPVDSVSGRGLPLRMESRSAALFVGTPDWLKPDLPLESITACVAYTDCDKEFDGMTEDWKDFVKRKSAGLAGSQTPNVDAEISGEQG